MDLPYKQVFQEILKYQKPISFLHLGPDPDSICSNLALYQALKTQGIDLYLISLDPVSDDMQNLFDTSMIHFQDPAEVDYSQFDVVIGPDIDNEQRVTRNTDFKLPNNLPIINIDHHESNEGTWGTFKLIDKEASSTCLMLVEVFRQNGIEIDQTLAATLLCGILTDNGFYSFQSVRQRDLLESAYLMDQGADLFDLGYKLRFEESEEAMKYKGLIYKNLKTAYDKGYAYSTCSIAELQELGIDPLQLSNLHVKGQDLIKKLKGVKFIFFIKENPKVPKSYDVGLRSHEKDYDVSVIAKHFGGGGHKPAASGHVDDMNSMEEAVSRVTDELAKLL